MGRSQQQVGAQGTYVATYYITGSLRDVLRALRQNPAEIDTGMEADLLQLLHDMHTVEPNSVVFNWECCSGCASEKFVCNPETNTVLDLIEFLLSRGHMVMCSDFSLKALIKNWCPTRLGPNPFRKIGGFGGKFMLHLRLARGGVPLC